MTLKETWESPSSCLTHLALDNNTGRLAAVGLGHLIWLGNTHEKRFDHTLEGHINWTLNLAISADNRFLASGAHDETVRQWPVESGECAAVLKVPPRMLARISPILKA